MNMNGKSADTTLLEATNKILVIQVKQNFCMEK